MLGLGLGQWVLDLGQQAGVAGEAEDVVDAVGLAPAHQLVAGEARVGAQEDLDPWPALADLADDARDLVLGPGRGVDVRAPQLGGQQVTAAEHVQRQVAVAVVVAVEEAALLVAVQRIVGRIQIEDDLFGRRSGAHRGTGRRTAPRSPPRRGRSCGSGRAPRSAHARAGSTCSCRPAARSPCAAPRACRPGSPAPDRGAARRGRRGPRSPARGRRCAASAWSRRRARPAPASVRR